MLFSIAIIVIILGVTYMHYLQGAFTSAISMACALAATLVAFGYYENAIDAMTQNGFADFAGGASLIMIFTVTYAVLRVIADIAVPGNIGLQLYVEKVGSVVFGFIAAMLGAGVFATAVQMMPVGAAVAGYSPYEIKSDRDVAVPNTLTGRQRGTDTKITDELAADTFEGPPGGMLLPADHIVLNIVKTASAGSFSGSQSFSAIHPELTTEAFAARLGPDRSGKHVILNTAKQPDNVSVDGIFTIKGTPKALDTEVPEIRDKRANLAFKPSNSDTLVVIRAVFKDAGTDKDNILRLPPAAARLVIDDKTYYPIGSMETRSVIGLSRLDDFMFVPVLTDTNAIDLVYSLPKSAADKFEKKAGDDSTRFIEFKLFGRVDLGSKTIDANYAGPSKNVKVLRKKTTPLMKEVQPEQRPVG
ncbi:MAG: CvpA family protein [Tepidisphaeraceae bacterium]